MSIYVKEHDLFRRNQNDIYCEAKISFTQAVFGDEIDVPTIQGRVKMKIPPATAVGKVFRLRGRGVPDLLSGSGKGDELVRINVDIPRSLTDEQKNILKEFAKTLGEKGKKNKRLFEKVKKVFE